MARPIKRWEFIELVIPAGTTATRFNFPDIPQLRDDSTQDIIIRGIKTYNAVSMPNTPNNNPVATLAQLLNTFLVLYIEGEESIHWIPLGDLCDRFQNGAGGTQQAEFETLQFHNLKIDWTKSYVWAAQPYANNAAFSFAFSFMYDKLPPGTIDALEEYQTKNLLALLASGR